MEDLENIRKNLKLLNYNNLDHFYDNCINDLYYKRFFQVIDSNINDSDKKFLLKEINNAKVILGKVDLEDLKKIIEEDIFNMKTDEEAYQEKTTEKIFNTEIIKTDQNNKLSQKLNKKGMKKSPYKMFKKIIIMERLKIDELSIDNSVILPEQIIIRNHSGKRIVTYWRDINTKRWYKKNIQVEEEDYIPVLKEWQKRHDRSNKILLFLTLNFLVSLFVAIARTFYYFPYLELTTFAWIYCGISFAIICLLN